MARKRPVYSPALSRLTVKALHHEAKSRGVPMTELADCLLRESLKDSQGWRQAEQEMAVPKYT